MFLTGAGLAQPPVLPRISFYCSSQQSETQSTSGVFSCLLNFPTSHPREERPGHKPQIAGDLFINFLLFLSTLAFNSPLFCYLGRAAPHHTAEQ